jgi:tetraacyldisaccharide 4'-kinase
VGLVLVDDGFSTWSLERDLDVVLLDARDLWGGGALLPAGRLREPRRALQRAECVVVSRLAPGQDPEPLLREVRGFAPAARLAAGRHVVRGLAPLRAWDTVSDVGRVRVVTGTGNPQAVAASAVEAGLEVVTLAPYRDHHWFTSREVRHELAEARRERARVLLTAKDAVRWEQPPDLEPPVVLRVDWAWVTGGEAIEAAVLGADAGVLAGAEAGSGGR